MKCGITQYQSINFIHLGQAVGGRSRASVVEPGFSQLRRRGLFFLRGVRTATTVKWRRYSAAVWQYVQDTYYYCNDPLGDFRGGKLTMESGGYSNRSPRDSGRTHNSVRPRPRLRGAARHGGNMITLVPLGAHDARERFLVRSKPFSAATTNVVGRVPRPNAFEGKPCTHQGASLQILQNQPTRTKWTTAYKIFISCRGSS